MKTIKSYLPAVLALLLLSTVAVSTLSAPIQEQQIISGDTYHAKVIWE